MNQQKQAKLLRRKTTAEIEILSLFFDAIFWIVIPTHTTNTRTKHPKKNDK